MSIAVLSGSLKGLCFRETFGALRFSGGSDDVASSEVCRLSWL